jgi:predicted SAM-dependent methyltransferase
MTRADIQQHTAQPELRVNVGCGGTPTPGWLNFDNSYSVILGRYPWLLNTLRRIRLINSEQWTYAKASTGLSIRWAEAERLPLASNSVVALYTSHMLEHLSQNAAKLFVAEARRVLRPRGVLRVVVPDLRRLVEDYLGHGDADRFVSDTLLSEVEEKSRIRGQIRRLFVGARNHRWMYDAQSLTRLLAREGFVDVQALPPGETRIQSPGALDLRERESESVYVEGLKPISGENRPG